MEFKAKNIIIFFAKFLVDIGTEWNLKQMTKAFFVIAQVVDIGTEWNLKVIRPTVREKLFVLI